MTAAPATTAGSLAAPRTPAWAAVPRRPVQLPRAPAGESLEGQGVLLMGGYGVGNLGDEAILAGLIQQHDLWDATVTSYDPELTTRLHGVHAVSPFGPGLLGAFARSRCLVIGGGGIFSAYMGPFARGFPALALAAKALGKRVEFRAFGAYRGTPAMTARTLALAVRRADHVSVRDASSAVYLRSLGVERPIAVVPDPALALEPPPAQRTRALLAEHAPGLRWPFVALGARRVKGLRAQRRLEGALTGLATTLAELQVGVLWVPFSRHPYAPFEDDAGLAERIAEEVGAGAVLQGEHAPRDVLGVVAQAACVVPVRFHALVFALRAGRPLVAVPYDTKCTDLLREVGLPGLAPQALTARSLTDRVLETLDARAPRHPPSAGLLGSNAVSRAGARPEVT